MFRKTGFTLAELLIALAILGVIATFAIPKILAGSQDNDRKAVYKETIATLSSVLYQGALTGELCNQGAKAYLASHLNYVKHCTSNNTTEGCWAAPTMPTDDDPDGYVFHNGAFVVDIESTDCSGNSEGITIDWNGALGPNTVGDDRMTLLVYYQNTGSHFAGTVLPYSGSAPSVTLYNQIFN